MNSNTDKSLDSYGKGTLKNDNDDTQSDDAEPPSSEIDVLTVKINGDPKNTSSEQNSDASNNAYKGHKERKAPVDSGWAWVVLVAAFFELFISIGMMRCYGIFFLHFQQKFSSTSSVTSLVSTLQNAFYSFSGLFVMTVGLRFISCRKSVVLGGLLTGVAYLFTAFLEDIRAVLFVNGAFVGFSLSFVYLPVMSMLSVYFEKRRGLANNISNAGVSLGGLLLVPLFTYLFEEYGYSGAFLLAAGVYLNIIVFGMLLRPVEFYTKRRTRSKPGGGSEKEVNLNAKIFKKDKYDAKWSKNNVKRGDVELFVSDTEFETSAFLEKDEGSMTENSETHRRQHIYEQNSPANSVESLNTWYNTRQMKRPATDAMQTSQSNMYNSVEKQSDGLNDEEHLCKPKTHRNIVKCIWVIFDFSILKDPLFLFYLLCTVFLCAGNSTTPFYVAPLANEIGMNAEQTAAVLMVTCVVDLLSRVLFGFISDKTWLKRSNLIALSSGILGAANILVYFVGCFVTLTIFAVVMGLLQGVYFSLFVVVIVDYLGLENLQSALGVCCLVQGLCVGCALPVAGFLKDVSGTYVTSYIFIGVILLIGAALTTLLPVVQRWRQRRNSVRTH